MGLCVVMNHWVGRAWHHHYETCVGHKLMLFSKSSAWTSNKWWRTQIIIMLPGIHLPQGPTVYILLLCDSLQSISTGTEPLTVSLITICSYTAKLTLYMIKPVEVNDERRSQRRFAYKAEKKKEPINSLVSGTWHFCGSKLPESCKIWIKLRENCFLLIKL